MVWTKNAAYIIINKKDEHLLPKRRCHDKFCRGLSLFNPNPRHSRGFGLNKQTSASASRKGGCACCMLWIAEMRQDWMCATRVGGQGQGIDAWPKRCKAVCSSTVSARGVSCCRKDKDKRQCSLASAGHRDRSSGCARSRSSSRVRIFQHR